jgi:microcystin-dependent protein
MKKNLSLQMLLQNQSSPDIVINENFTKIESFIFNCVIDILTVLPSTPENGDMYILSSSHQNSNNIALFLKNKGWTYFIPENGWKFFVKNLQSEYCFLNNSWQKIISGSVNCDWNATSGSSQILNKPILFDGKYESLTGKPQLHSVATSGNYNELTNKPTIPTFIDQYSIGDFKQSMQNANHGKWLLCNGQSVSRTGYSALFSLIGTTFGIGDGTTTFNLPDCRGRINGSSGQGVGLTNRTNGQVVGSENHTLTIDEMPSHSHGQYVSANSIGSGIRRDYTSDGACSRYPQGINTDNAGGGQAHNNMQPTIFIGNTFIYAGI